jgi:hypothetical protein
MCVEKIYKLLSKNENVYFGDLDIDGRIKKS